MRIGLIGAGRMGRPIAGRLAGAGHDVRALVRRPDAQVAASADGIDWRATIEETVGCADMVVIVVLNDAQVREACLGPDAVLAAMKPGAVLVQHTTANPATVLSLQEQAEVRGIRVLDAALSGGPHDIATGRLTLWVGGDETVLDELRPVLETYASPILFVGPLGNGQRVKLVNNALFVAQLGLAIDAVRLAGSLGIEEPAILSALQQGSGASRALSIVAGGGSVDAVAGRLGDLMVKDVNTVSEAAASANADLGLLGTVLRSEVVRAKVLGRTLPS